MQFCCIVAQKCSITADSALTDWLGPNMDGSEYTFVLFKYMHYLTPCVFYDGTVLYSSFDTVGIRILHEKIVVMCIIVILYIYYSFERSSSNKYIQQFCAFASSYLSCNPD